MSQALEYSKAPKLVIQSLFDKYDTNQNGKLTKTELYSFLQDDFGLDDGQAQTYLLLLDKNGDGFISYKEFETWFRSGENFKSINDFTRYYYLQKAIEFFKKYDIDESGSIDLEESYQLFQEYGGKHVTIEDFMTEMDIDNDGRISFEEFMKWLHWIPMDQLIIRRKSSIRKLKLANVQKIE